MAKTRTLVGLSGCLDNVNNDGTLKKPSTHRHIHPGIKGKKLNKLTVRWTGEKDQIPAVAGTQV